MIFETGVLIWFSPGDLRAADVIERAAIRGASIVSFMELFQGTRSRNEMRVVRRLHSLQVAGALIAAAACENGLPPVTGAGKPHRRRARSPLLPPAR